MKPVRLHAKRGIDDAIALAATDENVACDIGEFDTCNHLLNVRNGVVDLKTGALLPHDPEYGFTKIVDIDYLPDERCHVFEGFLGSIFDEPDLLRYLQRFLGYCLTGETYEQAMLILLGFGSNGKSTLLNAVRRVTGGFSIQASPKLLIDDRFGGVPEGEIARLRGPRLITVAEADSSHKMAAARVKALTGGEEMLGRILYHDAFAFTPRGKIILGTNGVPQMDAQDPALWRRLHLVRFTRVFTKDEQDHQLEKKLEAESAGILAWLVRGAVAWYEDGLAMPTSVRADVDALRLEFDPIGQFIASECTLGHGLRSPTSVLYGAFACWNMEQGGGEVSRQSFNKLVEAHGVEWKKSNGQRYYAGIALSNAVQVVQSVA
jgi:putative DNA primase/helicase